MSDKKSDKIGSRPDTLTSVSRALTGALIHQMRSIPKRTAANIPVLVGPPGMGKSEFTNEFLPTKLEAATGRKWGVVVHYLSTFPMEKMTGLPHKDPDCDGFSRWTTPDLLDMRSAQVGKDGMVLLLLDDIHLVRPNVAPYLYQFFSYRSLQGYKLGDNVVIMCAGNSRFDDAGAQPVQAPVMNRWDYLRVESNIDDWVNHFARPKGIRQDVVLFLRHNSSFLQTPASGMEPFASPRSWTDLARKVDVLDDIYGAGESMVRNEDNMQCDAYRLGSGLVGEVAAGDFVVFVESAAKWDADAIVAGKKEYPTLKDTVDMYTFVLALSGAVTSAVAGSLKKSGEGMDPLLSRSAKLVDQLYKSNDTFGVLLVQSLCDREAELEARVGKAFDLGGEMLRRVDGVAEKIIRLDGDKKRAANQR